jgi:hypothetical protein
MDGVDLCATDQDFFLASRNGLECLCGTLAGIHPVLMSRERPSVRSTSASYSSTDNRCTHESGYNHRYTNVVIVHFST